jgi:2-methylcitrate dehydratase PrpD
VIWPTVLAGHLDMNSLLDSSIRGYEAMICVGSSFDRHHYQRWHPTSTAGVMGAAVAASGVYGISRSQLINSLGNAGSVSGGVWQMRHESVMTKQFHVAHAVRAGLEVAHLSKCGFTGPRQILEGEQGLYAATCNNPKPMEFHKNWRIWEVSFKPWGACRHAHPAIDAALELQALLGNLDGEILVEIYADAVAFCDNPGPKKPQQAKFSIQHAVAVVATSGAPVLADFDTAAIRRHAKARSRVTVRECRDITARYPKHYGARVTCREQIVEMIDTLGDPERPMTNTQIIDKAHSLMAWGGLPKKQADKAVKLALEGDEPQAIRKMLGKWLA